MSKTIVLFAFPFLALGAASAAGADLGWDMTYQSVVSAARVDSREFMTQWIQSLKRDRPVVKSIADYAGDPVEYSLLVEYPGGHAGEPVAAWFIKTAEGAQACESVANAQVRCEPLDPAQVEALVREVAGFKPLEYRHDPDAFSDPHPRENRGDQPRLNYFGFISVYDHGKSSQRPIHSVELFAHVSPGSDAVGRLRLALVKAKESPEKYRALEAEVRREAAERMLIEAIKAGDVGKASAILDRDGDQAGSVLILGARFGRLAMVRLAVERGVKLDADGRRALEDAARGGYLDVVAYLVEKGVAVRPNLRSAYGSPLSAAIMGRQTEVAGFLLDHGADPNEETTESALAHAARMRDWAMMRLLLERGADPNFRGAGSTMPTESALMSVVRERPVGSREGPENVTALRERMAMIERLIDAGAKVNVTSECKSPYDLAAPEEVRQLLLKRGADPEISARCRAGGRLKDVE